MQSNEKENRQQSTPMERLIKNKDAVAQLARSGDARQLMDLLQQRGGVKEAAQAAANGDTGKLMAMMNQLMQSKDGAALVERIERQARQAGLE